MATQQELMNLLDQSARRTELTANAYDEVLLSVGIRDVTLSDGSITPNLNKRISELGAGVASVVGKTGDVTANDIYEALELGSASKYNVGDLPISTEQQEINNKFQKTLEYYVENWGAKGDGITDDSLAFNTALTELSTLFKADGIPRTLLVKANTTYNMRLVGLRPGVNIICATGFAKFLRTPTTEANTEAEAKWWRILNTAGNGDAWTTENDLDYRITLSGIILDGNYLNTKWTWNTYNQEQASCVILMGNNNFTDTYKRAKFHLENCLFMDSTSDGLHIWKNVDVTFRNLLALRCFRGGLVMTGGNSIVRGDGMVSSDARLDCEIDSAGIGGTMKSYLYLENYYQDVASNTERKFTGGCDIGGMGGGVMHLNNVNVHSYPLNMFLGKTANDQFEKLLIESSVFHLTNTPWYNPTNGTFRDTKFVLRNDIIPDARISVLMGYLAYTQDNETDFTFDNCQVVSFDQNPVTKSTLPIVRIESQNVNNKQRLKFINSDLSKAITSTYSFYGLTGGSFYIDNCKINTPYFIGGGGAFTSAPTYPMRLVLGNNEFGPNTTKYLNPAWSDTVNVNELTFLQNCSIPEQVNSFIQSPGQNGYPAVKKGFRTINGLNAPTTTTPGYNGDIFTIQNKEPGKPYEWICTTPKLNFGVANTWVATKWVVGSFITANLPVLGLFDVGVENFDTSVKMFKTWSGTEWISGQVGVESVADLTQIVNPKDGQTIRVKSYSADTSLGGGIFVYDSTSTDTANAVTIFSPASGVGRWARPLDEIVTPYHAGAVNKTDSTVALERYLTCMTNNPTLKYLVVGDFNTIRPLNLIFTGKTIDWDLKLKAIVPMKYMFAWAAYGVKHYGNLALSGTGSVNNYQTMSVGYGLILNGVQGSTMPDLNLSLFKYYGVMLDEGNVISDIPMGGVTYKNNTMLEHKNITARDCGMSMWVDWANLRSTSITYSNPIHTGSSGTGSQRTTLTLSSMVHDDTNNPGWAIINNITYRITSYDLAAKTISVFPWLEKDEPITGSIYLFWGGAIRNNGSNGGPTKIGAVDAIRCTTGIHDDALYGCNATSITSQYCVAGHIAGSGADSISPQTSKIIGLYTEVVYRNLITIGSGSIAIDNRYGAFANEDPFVNCERIAVNNRTGDYGAFADTLGFSRVLMIGNNGNKTSPLYYKGKGKNQYNLNATFSVSSTDTIAKTYKRNSATFNLIAVDSSNKLLGQDETQIILVGTGENQSPTGAFTFNPPSGWTVNGSTQFVLSGFSKSAHVLCYFEFNTKNVIITLLNGDFPASQLIDNSGRNQQEINDLTVTPFNFGAIGDGINHPLSERYATLALAQAKYPHATALTDSIDWAALQAFFDYCKANRVKEAVMSGKFSVNKELNFVQSHNALTKRFTGYLEIIATAPMNHVLRIAGSFLAFENIKITRSTPAIYIPNGLYIGGYFNSNTTICSSFEMLDVTGFDVASVRVDQNTMFCSFGVVRGMGGKSGTTTFNNLVQSGSANVQLTTMNVGIVPAHKSETNKYHPSDIPDPNTFVILDSKCYLVKAIDRTAGTISIYPQYRGTMTSGSLTYLQGAAFHHGGNNSGCIEIGTISVIGGGTGFSETGLYSCQVNNFIAEACPLAISVGMDSQDPCMNFNISRGYFEANTIDYCQVSTYASRTQARMMNLQGMDFEKKVFIQSNLGSVTAQGDYSGALGQLGAGSYDVRGRLLSPSLDSSGFYATRSIELGGNRESRQLVMVGSSLTFNFTVSDRLVELFGLSEMSLVIKDPLNGANTTTGSITLNCPPGYTFDGTATTMTLSGFYKPPVIYVSVYKQGSIRKILVTCDGLNTTLENNTFLTAKADKSTTYTKSETNSLINVVDGKLTTFSSAQAIVNDKKADLVYVNDAISGINTVASKFYPTLAQATADIANLVVDQPVTIGEKINGGLWYKPTANATSLTRSPWDPIVQAKEYDALNVKEFVNLTNPLQSTTQGFFAGTGISGTGNQAYLDYYIGNDYYPAKVGDKFWMKGVTGGQVIQYCRADKTAIWNGVSQDIVNDIFTVPSMQGAVSLAACEFIRIGTNLGSTAFSSGKVGIGKDVISPSSVPAYNNYYAEPTVGFSKGIQANLGISSPLKGKTVITIGDSIQNNPNTAIKVLCDRHGATLTKHTMDGAWVSHGNIAIPRILSETYVDIGTSVQFDLIMVAAGTNDLIDGTNGVLGTFTDRTTSTFYGALHTLLSGLRSMFPKSKIVYVSQIPRSGLRTNPITPTALDIKVKAVKEVCSYYSIPLWIGHENFGWNPDDNAITKADLMPDGLHPSVEGHVWYANRLENFILSNSK